jgi:hypothetical protein
LTGDGFVLRPRSGKRVLHVTVPGANRGARAAVDALAALNANSTAMTVVPHYVDPIGGRADSMAASARARGLDGATGVAARIQDERALVSASDLVIHHLDRADAIATSLLATTVSRTPSLSYLAIQLPGRGVLGVATVDDHSSPQASAEIQAFFRGVARVSARAGSEAVFGLDAPIESNQAEALIRGWFARHTNDCVEKLAAGITPTRYPIEITFDGDESIGLHVFESDAPAESLEALAEAVLANPHTPVPRGTRFVVCEVLPTSLRFVTVRHRSLGGVNATAQLSVREGDIATRTATHRTDAGGGIAMSLLSLLVGVSVLANASSSNPVRTTD